LVELSAWQKKARNRLLDSGPGCEGPGGCPVLVRHTSMVSASLHSLLV